LTGRSVVVFRSACATVFGVINKIEGLIITFREERYSTIISSECGKAAIFPSKIYARFGANVAPASQRKRVLANGGLLDVHLGACQQAVVDFMFAAIPDIQGLA